ncbi:MAG: DEAD/DEAH box helicase [Flavobacteriales bacterium]|nr:DEAD/DEAH box helicase [Flavobacteriales bacterium]
MRISAQASFDIVYSISVHPQLGPVVEPYIVELTSAGNLSMVNQKVHSINADYFDKKLDENDYKAIKLLDECSPEFITKKFSKIAKIKPRDFFEKQFDDQLFQKRIRPHIEKKLAEALELIRNKKLYFTYFNNIVYQPIEWATESASVLFHLRRNETNTHYFATVKYNNHRLHFSQNNSLILSTSPCFLMAGNMLLHFENDFDGAKIKPFISRKFIEIPRASEEQYFKKFVVPLLEKNDVYAVGLEIVTERHEASPVIKLTRLLDGSFGVVLAFNYGIHEFPYHSLKKVSVSLHKTGDSYIFKRIKRSSQWEEIKKQTLEMYGLHQVAGSEFSFENATSEHSVVEWAVQNKENLLKAGFRIKQNFSQEYSLEESSMHLVASMHDDWFDVHAKIILGGIEVSIKALRAAIKKGTNVYMLPNGEVAVIPQKWIDQIQGLALFSQSEDELKLKKQHIGIVEPLLRGNDLAETKNQFIGVQDVELPLGFEGQLRPYQKAGFNWLYFLYRTRLGGCLADDMGLGKTVQSLAFLQKIKEESGGAENQEHQGQTELFSSNEKRKTSLLVVPTSLIYNWVVEAKKFTPDLKILRHVGLERQKHTSFFSKYDLVITTYGTARNDMDFLKNFHFEIVILDESQFIKNPTSQLAKKINLLQAQLKITLTGTPIENTITDLWSQMNFVNAGLLGNYKFFEKQFVQPIEKQFDIVKSEQLQQIIKPFVMRRTKMQVATDLPPKTEQIVYCDMTELQQDIYEKTKSTYRNMILDSVQKNGLAKSRIQLLAGLTKLRQIANHPLLDNPDYEGDSGKFEQIEQMLFTALEENHNLLIFSQFVGHLSLVENLLKQNEIDYSYLDGSTPQMQRKKEVERFQNNEKRVFLISLKAGGFGLNLTAADYVFLLDPWWNPAAENQAIDRTHRIGQTQNVFSYKFVTNNSVEEKIIGLQNRKKELSNSLIKTEESYIKQVTLEDIEQIFG